MGKIHILSEQIANKIAAGEVIERPASIVKELIENSLDAGATQIAITIKHGGKSLIRVVDDGCGMTAEDAELSVQRHATSKIEKSEDLFHIQSLGFRGEALPSIAAVSRFLLQTRPPDKATGTELVMEGGSLSKVCECAMAAGTVVEVRDLFFNTPARRKFLKQDTTEMGHILDVVTSLAMANLKVRFLLESGDKKLLNLCPTEDLAMRARALLGDAWADQAIYIQNEIPHIRVHGLIGKPVLASGNRAQQFFFINRRYVKAYGLSHGLQAGYHGLLMQHQFPAAVLFLDIDPQYVDINVHPTKLQVRLSHEALIKSLIEKTVSAALQEHGDLAPTIGAPVTKIGLQETALNLHSDALPFSEPVRHISSRLKVSEPSEEGEFVETHDFQLLQIGKGPKVFKVLGQIQGAYILAETENGYMIVDQHAAHERVMFESLMNNFESGQPAVQGLLIEEVLELHFRQVEILNKEVMFLRKIGFEIEFFGDHSFVIRGVPFILKDENPIALVKQFVDEIEQGKIRTRLNGCQENIAALIACKQRSVKASDPLTLEAMEGLLQRLAACKNPFHCPHGRPSFVQYSLLELEKQFKRK